MWRDFETYQGKKPGKKPRGLRRRWGRAEFRSPFQRLGNVFRVNPSWRSRSRRSNPYRRNPEIDITFRMNLKTGKKDIHVELHSDDDAMPHEHEKDHRRIVEQLIGQGIIGAAEMGNVTIKRVPGPPAPLKGRQEQPPERGAIATRKRKAKKAKNARKTRKGRKSKSNSKSKKSRK